MPDGPIQPRRRANAPRQRLARSLILLDNSAHGNLLDAAFFVENSTKTV
jgi:hypothetical protein